MTLPHAPAWLQQLQRGFGRMLRAPLDPGTGTFCATPANYPSELVDQALASLANSATERLATYNRQYWFRLFAVLQGAYPLTTQLIGHFNFNKYATTFLLERPPRGWDIDAVADGFADFLACIIDSERGERGPAVVEAARIDFAFHRVFRAASREPLSLDQLAPGRLPRYRLELSPAAALLTEHWPLCEMRRELHDRREETPAPLRPRLTAPRSWLLLRRQQDIGLLPLESREVELLELMARHSLAEALARVEAACSEAERVTLPTATRRWLERSMALGLWVGFSEEDAGI